MTKDKKLTPEEIRGAVKASHARRESEEAHDAGVDDRLRQALAEDDKAGTN